MTAPVMPLSLPAPIQFDFKKWMLLVEGAHDKAFFDELCKVRSIPDYSAVHGLQNSKPQGGKDGFSQVLLAMPTQPGFEAVEGIIVVMDSDADPSKALDHARKHLNAAGFGVPDKAMEWAKSSKGLPDTAILLLPWEDETGDLEKLLLPTLQWQWPERFACMESYAACTKCEERPVGKQSKMKLRALLTGICPDPYMGLSNVWQRSDTRDLIPVTHASLDRVAEYLRTRQRP